MRLEQGENILVFGRIYGVDFSGAKLAGENTWVARMEPAAAKRRRPRYILTSLVRPAPTTPAARFGDFVKAVHDGAKFLAATDPEAQQDFSDLLDQMQRTIEGLARVTSVIAWHATQPVRRLQKLGVRPPP